MKPNHKCDPARMALLYIRQQFICTTFKFDAYNIIKTLFYTSATTLIFLCTQKKKNFKTVCIASFIITYCISQFGLLFPCVNPLAIVSSFSLICGGYEITWFYGMIELTLYTLLLYLFIRKRIRKVDF